MGDVTSEHGRKSEEVRAEVESKRRSTTSPTRPRSPTPYCFRVRPVTRLHRAGPRRERRGTSST